MASYIGILGSCATGKSTRVNKLVEHLENTDFEYQEITYTFEKNDKTINMNAGRFYPELSMFIVGTKTKKGNWCGADGVFGKLGSRDCLEPFVAHVLTFADTFLVEGYFGVGGTLFRPESLKEYFSDYRQYFFTYGDVSEYVERTVGRTGISWEDRGKDPLKSAGWKSNKAFRNSIANNTITLAESGMSGEILDLTKDEDVNYFIERFEQGVL